MLTPQRAEILRYLIEYHQEHGIVPTMREMMAHFGWSATNAAQEQLQKLARDGYLQLGAPKKCRAYRIVRRPDGSPYVPDRDTAANLARCDELRQILPPKTWAHGHKGPKFSSDDGWLTRVR